MPELSCFVVVLAEEPDGSGARLELQVSLELDEEDESLAMNTYCLCTETGATCYGGVSSWSLVGDELKVELEPRAARILGVEGGFVIDLVADYDARIRLKSGLERVFNAST